MKRGEAKHTILPEDPIPFWFCLGEIDNFNDCLSSLMLDFHLQLDVLNAGQVWLVCLDIVISTISHNQKNQRDKIS